jgi:hypothetical protein
MMHAFRGFGLAAALVSISSFAVVPKARAASTPSTAAYVYIQIQGPQGSVYGFSASSTGKLSAIPGAPWKPAGQIVGSNKSQFLTLGQTLIHSYGIAANGAIGSQLAQEPVFDYQGSECGGGSSGQDGAVLDHSGKYIYVMLDDGFKDNETCGAYQSYIINSDGSFSFDGETQLTGPESSESGGVDGFGLPSILGNESFAYALYQAGGPPENEYYLGLQRESNGTLEYEPNMQVTVPTDPNSYYVPLSFDASPVGNTFAVELYPGWTAPAQLGVFTANSEGSLSSTNTSSNMPTSPFTTITGTTFSPSGNMFVIYSNSGSGSGAGIQIYNANGAAPLTPYKTLLSGTPIDQVGWDSSNHLYAISNSNNKLYVFTVTSTSVTQDTAWSIGSPFKMIVVSNGSAGAASQFETPLLTTSGALAVAGQVTIDTVGNTTVEMTGQPAGATYTLQFCPAYGNGDGLKAPACFNITTVTASDSGSGSSTVKFPQSGNWAGEFALNDSSGASVLQSGIYTNVSNENYMSTLVPESTTNGGEVTATKGQDPLSSGTVSYSNNTAVFTVNGTSPNAMFDTQETYGSALDSSNTYAIGSFTTNASGNGSLSVNLSSTGEGGDMFNVEGGSGAGFIGGFSIP